MTNGKINGYIDYTILKPTTTKKEIIELCAIANDEQYNTVCVPPYYVKLAKKQLGKKSVVKVCTVVGFPLGYDSTDRKISEAKEAIKDGADEIDMVINQAAFKNKEFEYCIKEINAVKKAIKNKVLKVIVETANLDESEKVFAAKMILESNADFIKTSTGFAASGADPKDIALFQKVLGGRKQIKAAGGIKTIDEAREMIMHGATRIGTSSKL